MSSAIIRILNIQDTLEEFIFIPVGGHPDDGIIDTFISILNPETSFIDMLDELLRLKRAMLISDELSIVDYLDVDYLYIIQNKNTQIIGAKVFYIKKTKIKKE